MAGRVGQASRGRRVAAAAAIVATLSLCLASCGTRLSDEKIIASSQVLPAAAAPSGTTTSDTSGAQAAVGITPAAPIVGGTDSTTSPAQATQPSAGPKAAATASPAQGSTGAVALPGKVSAACPTQLAPISIGQIGAFSGVVGGATRGIRTGLAVWLSQVNATGGIQCHPVQLHVVDDGSDPSRTAAAAADLIQTKKVVAFVGSNVPLTMTAYRSVVSKAQIPTVGGDGVPPAWNEDPYLFPQGSDPTTIYAGAAAQMVKTTGKQKMGVIYCVEASFCPTINEIVKDPANESAGGYKVVLSRSSSITQTDYTSECQNLKQAGAEMVWIALDGASTQRVAKSCTALGYRPAIAVTAIQINAGLTSDPNLAPYLIDIASPVAPFVSTDTPALQAFHAAFKTYANPSLEDGSAMIGWTAGKLFEAAMNKVAAARTGPVTTAMVMDGLYALKNETLGGLSPGVTYVRGKPAPRVTCFFHVQLTGGTFGAPSGSGKQCLAAARK